MLNGKEYNRPIYKLLYNKYYVDELYARTVVKFILWVRLLCDFCDKRILDYAVDMSSVLARKCGVFSRKTDTNIVDGLVTYSALTAKWSGKFLQTLQTGSIRNYLYVIMSGVIILIIMDYIFLSK
jgi:NADH-quinone oxidoreductase subunit L